jgi:hypothetical protein
MSNLCFYMLVRVSISYRVRGVENDVKSKRQEEEIKKLQEQGEKRRGRENPKERKRK